MSIPSINYLTDADGNPKAVVIPIELWRRLMPQDNETLESLAENLEDYCLNKAMDETKTSPLLSREDALQFLEEEEAD